MKIVKVVHTKETIMTSNNITELVTQKQSNEKIPQKYGALVSQEAITVKLQLLIGALPGIHRTSQEHCP